MKVKFKMKENPYIGKLVTEEFYFPGRKVMPSKHFRFGNQEAYFPGILQKLDMDDEKGWCSVKFNNATAKQQSYGIGLDTSGITSYDLIYAE